MAIARAVPLPIPRQFVRDRGYDDPGTAQRHVMHLKRVHVIKHAQVNDLAYLNFFILPLARRRTQPFTILSWSCPDIACVRPSQRQLRSTPEILLVRLAAMFMSGGSFTFTTPIGRRPGPVFLVKIKPAHEIELANILPQDSQRKTGGGKTHRVNIRRGPDKRE
jgi:hypothetical protein